MNMETTPTKMKNMVRTILTTSRRNREDFSQDLASRLFAEVFDSVDVNGDGEISAKGRRPSRQMRVCCKPSLTPLWKQKLGLHEGPAGDGPGSWIRTV